MENTLYYQNQYLNTFQADIIKFIVKDEKYHLQLSQTAFYPEGGGQPSDQGLIAGIPVEYVYKDHDEIWHIMSKLPEERESLSCQIDWSLRFDHMQQHLGQHILSAVLYNIHNSRTVGFHLGKDLITIDLDKVLTGQNLLQAEVTANQMIYQNKKVKAFYPDNAEIKKLQLRKLPEIEGQLRLVQIEDLDLIPCSGTHPTYTGEVGIIKLNNWSKYKEGLRLEFLCGQRALLDYRWKNDSINQISSSLSIPSTQITKEVKTLFDKNKGLDKEIKQLEELILDYKQQEMLASPFQEIKGIKIIKKIFTDQDYNKLRLLALKNSTAPAVISLLGLEDQENARFIFSRSAELNEIDMNKICKKVLAIIDGKGGGNPQISQGGGPGIGQLDQLIEEAYQIIINTIK